MGPKKAAAASGASSSKAAKSQMFDTSKLRDEITKRWADPRYRNRVLEQFDEWGDSPVPGGPPGVRVTRLEMIVLDTIDEIKENFEGAMWQSTIKMVTVDLPLNAKQLIGWVEAFVNEQENAGMKAKILEKFPRMREHPDTDNYMKEMILPFRSVVVSQVVAATIDTALTGGQSGAQEDEDDDELCVPIDSAVAKARQKTMGETNLDDYSSAQHVEEVDQPIEKPKKKKKEQKHGKLFPSHVHAAHHAQDIDDVFMILTYVPNDASGLEKHLESQKRNGVCTRFAEYNLFYLRTPEDASDEEWIKALTPIALKGLAHAQFDVSQCCMSLKREEEALAWMERAGKLGHSRAMLSCAKLHLSRAFRAIKYAKHGGAGTVKKKTDEGTREALKWLDELQDADWDEGTPDDIEAGKKMLEHLEREALALKKAAAAEEQKLEAKKARRFWWYFFAAVAAALAIWFAFSEQRVPLLGMSAKSANAEPEPTHVNKYVRQHV